MTIAARRYVPVITALLVGVGLSSANGFINGVIAYERDTTVFYYPLFEWASQQLHSGVFPLWCPQMLGGYPLLADSELGLASPFVLPSLLTLPPDAAFVWLRLVFMTVAALGGYALARAWRLSRASGVDCCLPARIPRWARPRRSTRHVAPGDGRTTIFAA